MTNGCSLSKARTLVIAGPAVVAVGALVDLATGMGPIGGAAAFVATAILAFLASKAQTQTEAAIDKAIACCRKIDTGDFEARILGIDQGGRIGELLNAINSLVDRADAYIRESALAMEHASKKRYYRKIMEGGMAGSYLHGARVINKAIDHMDEVQAYSLNLVEKVNELVGTVTERTNHIVESSDDSAHLVSHTGDDSVDVAEASMRITQNLNAVAAATEELMAAAGEIGRQVTEAAGSAATALSDSERATGNVQNLADAARQISSIIGLINDIADQTNLLALNATIEAARAGEAGKGFAVVANEVKVLANQTTNATKDVAEQVAAIQARVTDVVNAIDAIHGSSVKVNEISTGVAAAIEEQNAATQEISRQVRSLSDDMAIISQKTESVAQSSAQSTSSTVQVIWDADDIVGPTRELTDRMAEFRDLVSA